MKLPVVIPVRDRLIYLEALLEALKEDDHIGTIHLFDMASTWPPMIEQLRKWSASTTSRIRVHLLKKNLGARGLFGTLLLRNLAASSPLLITDPDVIPERPAAKACLNVLLKHPRKYAKVGLSLRIDDLPLHYPQRERVLQWEKRHWTHPNGSYDGSALYDADVATTYCVIRSLDHVNHNGDGSPACRIGPPFSARHIPWYEDPGRLTPDVEHYYKNAPMRRWGTAQAGISWRPT